MEWTVLSCAFLAIFVSVSAKPEVSPSEQGITTQPDPAAVLNNGGAISKGFLHLLHDFMKKGDSLLKERLDLSHGHLNEQMTDGDSVLRGRISKGMADVREELREGDDRLKEELDNDVAWLKGKMEKEQSRLKEEVAEVEAKLKEETTEWKEDYDHLEHRVKQWEQSSRVELDDLRQRVSVLQLEQNITNILLQTMKTEMQTTRETLKSTLADLQAAQEKVRSLDVALRRTQEQLGNSTRCPDGWASHEGFCFFLSKQKHIWLDAKVTCEMLGGYLAEDSSTSRHDFLTGLIESHGLTEYVWIGLNDRLEENVFVWSHSGQGPNVTFWGQDPVQPNNDGDCVALQKALWWDRECYNTYPFICEKPAYELMIDWSC